MKTPCDVCEGTGNGFIHGLEKDSPCNMCDGTGSLEALDMVISHTKKLAQALRAAQSACIVASHHNQPYVRIHVRTLAAIVEQFDTKYMEDPPLRRDERTRDNRITINGVPHEVPRVMAYEDVVRLAGKTPDRLWSIAVTDCLGISGEGRGQSRGNGVLTPKDVVTVQDGTSFDIADTSRA